MKKTNELIWHSALNFIIMKTKRGQKQCGEVETNIFLPKARVSSKALPLINPSFIFCPDLNRGLSYRFVREAATARSRAPSKYPWLSGLYNPLLGYNP